MFIMSAVEFLLVLFMKLECVKRYCYYSKSDGKMAPVHAAAVIYNTVRGVYTIENNTIFFFKRPIQNILY